MTYQEILALQNGGGKCPHCESRQGHYVSCPLLNRNTAEQRSAATAHYVREAESAALFSKNVDAGFYRKTKVNGLEFSASDLALLAEMKITL